MAAADEPKVEGYPSGEEGKEPALAPAGEDGEEDGEDGGGAPDMAGLEAMMKGMGGGGEGGEGGMGGMDMNALMAMMGKGGGKGGGGMGGMADMMGGMGGMMGGGGMGGMGGKGGGKGQQEAEDTSEKVCEKWVWNQKGEEVHVRLKLEPPCTSKKEVEVKFKASHLVVKVRGETIIDGPMGGKIEVDESTWCFTPDKDELLIMLTKVDADAAKHVEWKDLLAAVN